MIVTGEPEHRVGVIPQRCSHAAFAAKEHAPWKLSEVMGKHWGHRCCSEANYSQSEDDKSARTGTVHCRAELLALKECIVGLDVDCQRCFKI